MKDTYYFSHDYNARTDDKIKLLIRKFGMVGYGIYWAIIEDLYNNANALRTDYDGIAFDLRTNPETVKWIVSESGLFIIEDEIFGSMSVQRRLDDRIQKSLKASESARKRWSANANALRTHCERKDNSCEGNAIKERKEKERKVEKENNTGDESPKKPKRNFLPPTLDEVKSFCIERKNAVNPERFFYHYQTNGWMVGKAKMKDWKAAVIKWEHNDNNSSINQQLTNGTTYRKPNNPVD